ncbi:unnamed protein product [Malus baccata var. baccata]
MLVTVFTSTGTKKAAAEWKHKASTFSLISFPKREVSKQRKAFFFLHCFCCHCYSGSRDNRQRITITRSHHCPCATSMEYESSDDDRHFNRKPSWLDGNIVNNIKLCQQILVNFC